MAFNKLGGIYYTETYEIQKQDYGGSIPCFIGRTNSTANRKIKQLQKFNNFEQVNKTVANGGLGVYEEEKDTNPLLKAIHDFCEETKMMTEEYVACPYFYVIDLGTASTIIDWIDSIEISKLKREIDFEVYVGFTGVTDSTISGEDKTAGVFESFILTVNHDLINYRQTIGDFRKAFFTLQSYDTTTNKYRNEAWYRENYSTTDASLIALANTLMNTATSYKYKDYSSTTVTETTITSNTSSKSRTYLLEPLWFGKTVGRISITPYDMEPGYYAYNTLTVDDIILRKPSEQLNLQVHGIIFNHLEETSAEEYVKINRTQAVSSNTTGQIPPDALFQARNLCDVLLTRLFDIVYPQIKNKETETNINYLQTQVNKVINDGIGDGDFIPPYIQSNERKGTFMAVQESSEDAYDLELVGMIQPVNCTYSIHIVAQINDAKIQVTSA